MKIAIISFYSGEAARGVENWTHALANELSGKCEIYVYQNGAARSGATYNTISSLIPFIEPKKSPDFFRRLFIDYKSRKVARHALLVSWALIRKKYDIVIPTNGGWQVAFVRIASWVRGSRMVIVGHSGRGWDERNNLYSFPDVFVGLTKEALKWARAVNPLVKSVRIPNGVDLQHFSPKGPVAKVGLGHPLVLAAAANEPGKRLESTIDAVSRIKNANLLLLCPDPDSGNLKSYAEVAMGGRCKVIRADYADMPQFYRAADVFTLASWTSEAFGMVYLEAMACGLPVVATDDAMRREIVGEAGVFTKLKSTKDYQKALETALSRKWGNKPRAQAEKFSWEAISEEYLKLFEGLTK